MFLSLLSHRSIPRIVTEFRAKPSMITFTTPLIRLQFRLSSVPVQTFP